MKTKAKVKVKMSAANVLKLRAVCRAIEGAFGTLRDVAKDEAKRYKSGTLREKTNAALADFDAAGFRDQVNARKQYSACLVLAFAGKLRNDQRVADVMNKARDVREKSGQWPQKANAGGRPKKDKDAPVVRITKMPSVKDVIVNTWNKGPAGEKLIREIFREMGFTIEGKAVTLALEGAKAERRTTGRKAKKPGAVAHLAQ